MNKKFIKHALLLTLGLCFINTFANAHALSGINLETLSTPQAIWIYLKLGFEHIIPLGADHILFILGLSLLGKDIKTLAWQATAFTIAHTITLGLAMYEVITPNTAIVEPIIALSIVLVAVENIFVKEINKWRLAIIFIFGLIHGMGFASVLQNIGLPQRDFMKALISFNIGVEIGQIAIIIAVYWGIIRWFGNKEWYHKRIVTPVSGIIGLIALVWAVERIF